jgi:hypothetical protein
MLHTAEGQHARSAPGQRLTQQPQLSYAECAIEPDGGLLSVVDQVDDVSVHLALWAGCCCCGQDGLHCAQVAQGDLPRFRNTMRFHNKMVVRIVQFCKRAIHTYVQGS